MWRLLGCHYDVEEEPFLLRVAHTDVLVGERTPAGRDLLHAHPVELLVDLVLDLSESRVYKILARGTPYVHT